MKPSAPLAFLLTLVAGPIVDAQCPLGYGVPKDVHFYAHGLTSDRPDPSWAAFEKAVAHLGASGIHRDVLDLVTMDMRGAERRRVIAAIDQVVALLRKVDWGLLTAKETVFAYRLAVPLPEYLLICRVPSDRSDAQVGALKSMLQGFMDMAGIDAASVRDVTLRARTMSVFTVEGTPIELVVGAAGDAVILATSRRMATFAMRRLGEGDGTGSLVMRPDFTASDQQLPAPTEATLFVDVKGVLDYLSQALKVATVGIPPGEGEEARTAISLMAAGLAELNVVDHVVQTTASDGRSVTATTLVQMQPEFEARRIAAVFRNQQPWTDWAKRVPADATGFSFGTGIDAAALFDLVASLAREHDVELGQLLGLGGGFFPRIRNVLAHVSGETAAVSFPCTGPHGAVTDEGVLFVRLRDPEGKVAEWLPSTLERGVQFLTTRGQHAEIVPVDGLHEIRLAAFPELHPVLGVRGNELVVASSHAAIAKLDRVRQGQEPDITKRPDFTELGVGGNGVPHVIAFGRVHAELGGLVRLVRAAGFFLSILPQDRDTRPLLKIGAILTKVAPALAALDMSYDWASETRPTKMPGAFTSRLVYRYHEQAPR